MSSDEETNPLHEGRGGYQSGPPSLFPPSPAGLANLRVQQGFIPSSFTSPPTGVPPFYSNPYSQQSIHMNHSNSGNSMLPVVNESFGPIPHTIYPSSMTQQSINTNYSSPNLTNHYSGVMPATNNSYYPNNSGALDGNSQIQTQPRSASPVSQDMPAKKKRGRPSRKESKDFQQFEETIGMPNVGLVDRATSPSPTREMLEDSGDATHSKKRGRPPASSFSSKTGNSAPPKKPAKTNNPILSERHHQEQMEKYTSAFSIVPSKSPVSFSKEEGEESTLQRVRSPSPHLVQQQQQQSFNVVTMYDGANSNMAQIAKPVAVAASNMNRPSSPFNKSSLTNNTGSPNIHLPLSSGFPLSGGQSPFSSPLLHSSNNMMNSFVHTSSSNASADPVHSSMTMNVNPSGRIPSPVPQYFTLNNTSPNNGRNSPLMSGGQSTPVMGSNVIHTTTPTATVGLMNFSAPPSSAFTPIHLGDNRIGSSSPLMFHQQRAPSPSSALFLPNGGSGNRPSSPVINNNPNTANNGMVGRSSSPSRFDSSSSAPPSPFIPESPTMAGFNSSANANPAGTPTGSPVMPIKRGRGRPRKNSLPPQGTPPLPDHLQITVGGSRSSSPLLGASSPSMQSQTSPPASSLNNQDKTPIASNSPRMGKTVVPSPSNTPSSNAPLITTLRFPKKQQQGSSSPAQSPSVPSPSLQHSSTSSPNHLSATKKNSPGTNRHNQGNDTPKNSAQALFPSDWELITYIRSVVQKQQQQPYQFSSQEDLISAVEQHFGVGLYARKAYIGEVYDLLCY